MRYLKQPRGPGTGWAFRMATPETLVGKLNPSTGMPFGREISFGLKTRRLPEARIRRDVVLGQIRALTADHRDGMRFSLERAEGWAKEIARHEKDGDGGPEDLDLREIVEEELERAKALPASKRPRKGAVIGNRLAAGQGAG